MLYIASNCEFDDDFFKKAGHYIGDELSPSYNAQDWSVFCTKLFRSGWCTGMQSFFEDVFNVKSFQELLKSYQMMKEFVCVQRAILPLYYAFERWPANVFFNHLDDVQDAGLGERIEEMILDLSGFNLWCVLHGADAHTLHACTNLKQIKTIEKTEKKKGANTFLAMGFRGCCYYKALLNKFLVPKFHEMRPEYSETFNNNAFLASFASLRANG